VDYIKKELDANVSAYDNLIHVGDLRSFTLSAGMTFHPICPILFRFSYAVARAYRWDMWMNEIEPIAARVPYMVSCDSN